MPAIERNIIIEKGADYAVSGYITDDNGNPVDISGSTFYGTIWDFCGSGNTKIADFVYAISLDTSVTPNRYKYTRTMARSVIDAITQNEGYWEQYEVNAANKSTKHFFGKVAIECGSTVIPA